MTEDSDTTTTAEEISDQIADLASRRDVLKSSAAATAAGLGLTAGAGGGAASGDETSTKETEDGEMTKEEEEKTEEEEQTEEEEMEEEAEGGEVTFMNQATDGSSVTVQEATLPEGGFMAIHDLTLVCDGLNPIESVIGASELLDEGEHEDIEVPLFESVPGAEFDQDQLESTQVLIAMPHLNTNDNETYDFVESGGEADGPYARAGAPVIGSAFAVVE